MESFTASALSFKTHSPLPHANHLRLWRPKTHAPPSRSSRLCREHQVRRELGKNQQGDSCPGRNIQESPGPWGGDSEAAAAPTVRGGTGAEVGRGASSRAAGPAEKHEGTGRGVASPAEKVLRLLELSGDPRPPSHPTAAGRGRGRRGSARRTWAAPGPQPVSKVEGASHLESGTGGQRALQFPSPALGPATYSLPSARWRRDWAAEGAS